MLHTIPVPVPVYRVNAPAMLPPNESLVWTTADELAFVRRLFKEKKVRALRTYVRLAHERRWYGEGMRVNAGLVILEARDLLERLVKETAD